MRWKKRILRFTTFFLQILDEGRLHDTLDREGDFTNAILLFTSNIGSQFYCK